MNIQNEDMLCFLYCIIAFLHSVSHNKERVNNYKKHLHKLNYEGIKMPMAIKDIDKFERMNILTINVYGCSKDGGKIWPRRISKRRDNRAINLLMLNNGAGYHYNLIRHLNRLVGKGGSGTHSKIFCPYCCLGFVKKYL